VSQSSSQSPGSSTHTGLLITLTIIAALGGLLFGYDTAVISGATDSIKQNFVAPLGLAESARISLEGWTISCALAGCIIGGALGGVIAHWLGRRGGLIVAGTLFFMSSLGSAWPESFIGVIWRSGCPTTRSSPHFQPAHHRTSTARRPNSLARSPTS